MATSTAVPGLAGTISRRRVIATLILAFAAVMAGLAVIDVVVLRTLRPQLVQLSRIGDEHARALSGATQLREQLAGVRRRIASTVRHVVPVFDPARDLAAVEDTVSDVQRVCDTPAEQASLARVHEALAGSQAVAVAVEQAVARGDREAARLALDDFTDRVGDVSRATDEIVRYNATEVRDAAREVHGSLSRAMSATSALAVLVLLAALVLLRSAVRSVSAHATLLERHAEETGAFAERAAHELRSPLQSLMMSLGALRAQAGPSTMLDRAESSTRRLASTVHEILEFSRSGGNIEAGARCDVSSVLAELEQELATGAAEARMVITSDVDPGAEVAMSVGYFRTVLSNLVGNAIKYGGRPEGGRIAITVRSSGNRVTTAIRDDGAGIPPDALPHVFEPFYRASSKREGYGLGLATVKRLVEAHGGRVSVSSKATGTTFVIDLPRLRAGSGAGAKAASATSSASRP